MATVSESYGGRDMPWWAWPRLRENRNFLGFWFLIQFLSGSMALMAESGTAGGVAWWAHIGGFVAGAILVIPFRYRAVPLLGGADHPSGLRIRKRFRTKRGDR